MNIKNTETKPAGLLKNKKIGLDLLRSYAIVSVVYGHGWYIAQYITSSKLYLSIKFDNVTMFFVITGFLISLKLFKLLDADKLQGKIVRDFWVQRLIRTYPLYLLMVSIVGAVYYLVYNKLPIDYFYYFIYFQNYNSVHPGFYSELWSLAIQEWFYFLFPLILWTISLSKIKNKRIAALMTMLSIIVFITINRFSKIDDLKFEDILYWDVNLRKQVVTRFDSLVYGGLMAYMLIYKADDFKKYSKHFLLIGLSLMILNKYLLAHNWFYTNYVYLSMTAISASFLLPFFYQLEFNMKYINKFIIHISTISYAMYLLHLTPVMYMVAPQAVRIVVKVFPSLAVHSQSVGYVAYWFLTLLLATWMHRFVAEPVTKFLQLKYAAYSSLTNVKKVI